MDIKNIKITFVGMESTEKLKDYVIEKITKYDHLLTEVTSIEVVLKSQRSNRGVANDFRSDITVILPKSAVRVEVSGENMFANIDEATDTMARRIDRYYEKKAYWEGATPWKVLEADAHLESLPSTEKDDPYFDYTPTINTRKKIEDMSPLQEGEAIEMMELLGYEQLLFKSKSNGKISMVYKRKEGGYGLVEPADEEI